MFEYEMHQSRHAHLVEEARRDHLVREARDGARAAREDRAARTGGTGPQTEGPAGQRRSLRSHFTRAA
ncbi:hypothetical protein [Streptomyces sp. NPDC058657]|uniref:hypothetical protein n=1 Tax=unclassified Streptomyces TaxID=2593676 RepID=UPI003649AF41